jgi:hypothetical protein
MPYPPDSLIIWITVKHVVGCFKVLNQRECLRQGLAPDDLILVSGSWLLISWKRSHTYAYKGIEDGIILLIMYIDIFSDNCSDNWSVWARRSEMSWSVLLEELASNHKQGNGFSRVQGQYQDSRPSSDSRKTKGKGIVIILLIPFIKVYQGQDEENHKVDSKSHH